MSRGFRDSDQTQAMSEKVVADQIGRILERGQEDAGVAVDGRCQDCGLPIGDERLQALPSALRCVRCQAAWEEARRR